MVCNASGDKELIAHWAFASATPQRIFVESQTTFADRDLETLGANDPEHLRRFATAGGYVPAEGTWFCDLFAKRFGVAGICGGYGRCQKSSSLPCHIHVYDESITILGGHATCMVQGSRYRMTGVSTAFVPQGKPHRFLNGGECEMEMLWVYAGDEPDRLVVASEYCSGSRSWPPEE